MTAYYNEFNKGAAQWLRELIAAGELPDGEVDERDIRDVTPAELAGFDQCHFFAGIGGWAYALRQAGWPDNKPVWTGSCPCQPFSAAGKRGGFDDERHLWPAFHHLIAECRPDVVFGEQVGSKDGAAWLDLVLTDMEATGYAFGAANTPSAGFGAPHIRQRLWFVAERMGNTVNPRLERYAGDENARHQPERIEADKVGSIAATGKPCGLAHADSDGPQPGHKTTAPTGYRDTAHSDGGISQGQSATGPANGVWRDADWLFCRDGKWRAVERGTFPLVDGVPSDMGRMRYPGTPTIEAQKMRLMGYGNAINIEAAKAFIRSFDG